MATRASLQSFLSFFIAHLALWWCGSTSSWSIAFFTSIPAYVISKVYVYVYHLVVNTKNLSFGVNKPQFLDTINLNAKLF